MPPFGKVARCDEDIGGTALAGVTWLGVAAGRRCCGPGGYVAFKIWPVLPLPGAVKDPLSMVLNAQYLAWCTEKSLAAARPPGSAEAWSLGCRSFCSLPRVGRAPSARRARCEANDDSSPAPCA